jgi:hypothetical protein
MTKLCLAFGHTNNRPAVLEIYIECKSTPLEVLVCLLEDAFAWKRDCTMACYAPLPVQDDASLRANSALQCIRLTKKAADISL